MLHPQIPFPFSYRFVFAGVILLFAGCSSSQELSPSDGLDSLAVMTNTAKDANQGTRYFIRGLSSTHLENYDEAVIYYHQALKHVSDSAAVFSGLAETHRKGQQTARAADFARRAVSADPSRPAYYYQWAELEQESQEPGKAVAAYRQLIDRFPDQTRAYYAMGKLQMQNDSTQAAIETFQHLIDRHGESVRARYQLLRIYRQEDDLPEMVRTLRVLIEEDSSNADLYFMLADVHQQQGDVQAAIETLEALRDQRPGNAQAAFRLVELYRRTGAEETANALLEETLNTKNLSADVLFDQARSLYFRPGTGRQTDRTVRRLLQRVLEVDSDHGQALFMLGTIHLQQHAYDEALGLLTRAVEENPRNQEAWIRVLIAGVNAGEYERTLQLAEEALLLFPRQFALLRLAGTASLQSGRHEQAADYLTRALEGNQAREVDDEMRSTVASMLGMVYNRLDEQTRSDSLYRQAIRWNEDNVTALNNYAYSLAERGVELEKALEMAHRAVDLAPESASFLDTLGWVYFKMDRLEDAALWIEKALETGSASAAVHEHFGDIQHRLGNDTQALEYWRKALRMDSDLDSVRDKIQQAESDE